MERVGRSPEQEAAMPPAEAEVRARLARAKRVVVKVGTSTITYPTRALDLENVDRIGRALANQMNRGREMVLVSSGAIAVGMSRLRVTERPRDIREKQAEAAIGQADLIGIYSRVLAEYGHIIGQLLLTRGDLEQPHSLANVRNTFEALLEKGVLPIVNENDTVSTTEVYYNGSFGDNDRLSAYVAQTIGADALIVFSDIDGLYDRDPHEAGGTAARLIHYADPADTRLEAIAGGSSTAVGTGGMVTKIQAARIAASAGIDMVITQGHRPGELARILAGEQVGTVFDGRLPGPDPSLLNGHGL